MDLRSKVRTTYQAPVPGARIRTRRADAYADWAYALVRERLVELCECFDGDTCGGHAGRLVPELDVWGEPTGKHLREPAPHVAANVRVEDPNVDRHQLRAGWRP